MQEKIANLEIKIFYDSAITKNVENYPNPSVSRGPTDDTAQARGVTAEQVGLEKCPPHPRHGTTSDGGFVANRQRRSACPAQVQLRKGTTSQNRHPLDKAGEHP